jgi:hypothetical protein
MRYLYLSLILIGALFLASALTTNGLLPSGHGTGRVSEVILGIGLIAFSLYMFMRRRATA